MPIPDLEVTGLLPPLLIEGEFASEFAPYKCTLRELCETFGHTPERRAILSGFLDFRERCRAIGISGFQWVAGSFLEDIEALDGRSPRDIDVATFIKTPDSPNTIKELKDKNPELFERKVAKEKYLVDHMHLPLRSCPSKLVSTAHYWYALYSHRRGRVWKGLLRIELGDESDDLEAKKLLADVT